MKTLFYDVFQVKKPIIAMIHLTTNSLESQLELALQDLETVADLVDGVLVEAYGATGEFMAEVTMAVCEKSPIPVGVNVLPNEYEEAFTIAQMCGAKFIQLDHVTGKFRNSASLDEDDYLSEREKFSNIAVLGGIHPKYYQMAEPIPLIGDSAQVARQLADAVVITGNATGGATSMSDIYAVREALEGFPFIIGSGLSPENAARQMALADGAIVGSSLKKRGVERGEPIDRKLTEQLMKEVKSVRSTP